MKELTEHEHIVAMRIWMDCIHLQVNASGTTTDIKAAALKAWEQMVKGESVSTTNDLVAVVVCCRFCTAKSTLPVGAFFMCIGTDSDLSFDCPDCREHCVIDMDRYNTLSTGVQK